MTRLFVSVIIPVRNEEEQIREMLLSVVAQDYPAEKTEILVIDGMSEDRTRQVVEEMARQYPRIRLIDNPERIVPIGLNSAIKQARGDTIVRMDGHSIYPLNYLSMLIHYQHQLNADNVGGVWITTARNAGLKALAIRNALINPFGVGNAHYRLGINQIREVDTVPFGCFKREVFDRIGLFDEELVRNQDDEFNARMKKNGMKVYLVPEIKIIYYARDTFSKSFRMFYQYGYFKPLVNKKLGSPATLRQFIPLGLVLFILSGLLIPFVAAWSLFYVAVLTCYLMMNLYFSWRVNERTVLCLATMYAHLVQHVAYGMGYLAGIVDFLILRRKGNKNMPMSR